MRITVFNVSNMVISLPTGVRLAKNETGYVIIDDEAYASYLAGIDSSLLKMDIRNDYNIYLALKELESAGDITISTSGSALLAINVGVADAGTLYTGANAEDCFAEVMTELNGHIAATPGAHAATAISCSDASLTATQVNAGLVEAKKAATDHIADATDAHDASAISVLDTALHYTATDAEAALAEVYVKANRCILTGKPEIERGGAFGAGLTNTPTYAVSMLAPRAGRVKSATMSVGNVGVEVDIPCWGAPAYYANTIHYRQSLVYAVEAASWVNPGGNQWTLAGSITKVNVVPSSVTIHYTIGGVPGTATDDGFGVIVGADVDLGGPAHTITYATGAVDVSFTGAIVMVGMTYRPATFQVVPATAQINTTIGGNIIAITDDGAGNLVDDAVHPSLAAHDTLGAPAFAIVGNQITLAGGTPSANLSPSHVALHITIGAVPYTITDVPDAGGSFGNLVCATPGIIDPAGTNTIIYATGIVDVTVTAAPLVVDMDYLPAIFNHVDYVTGAMDFSLTAYPDDIVTPLYIIIDFDGYAYNMSINMAVAKVNIETGVAQDMLITDCNIDQTAEAGAGVFGVSTDSTFDPSGVTQGVPSTIPGIAEFAQGELIALVFSVVRTAPADEFKSIVGQAEIEWL